VIWVGSFDSLRSVLRTPRLPSTPLEVRAWVRSEIRLISPLVDWLMDLIAGSRCVFGEETSVELALREALNNAILHGNRLDVSKLVHVRCCCERGKGVRLTVRDAGHGFDPDKIPDPRASENLPADHGRGIHLMKWAMDEVSFDRAGTEVHMRKASARKSETFAWHPQDRVAQWLVRPSLGRMCCRVASVPFRTRRVKNVESARNLEK
jgi:serine/threonine-protein kinase RsbW